MSSDKPAIVFSNVSKIYSNYHGLLKVKNFLDRIKNGQFRGQLVKSPDFVALDQVSFTIEKGEKVAFIGKNGAGKSTTLKLTGGVAHPTTGKVIVNGAVGGVLELGSGFHPDLTARDNIYLQGAIYGYTKNEIADLVPEIMEIAELREFLDVPLKKFSSGMKARLGFALSLSATPDIVLLDEVLSVGDAGFRSKSLDLMQQFLEKRTMLFVSHSISQVHAVCTRAIVINHGKVVFDGPTKEAAEFYDSEVLMKSFSAKPVAETQQRGVKRGFSLTPPLLIENASILANGEVLTPNKEGKYVIAGKPKVEVKFELKLEHVKPEFNVKVYINKLGLNDLSSNVYRQLLKVTDNDKTSINDIGFEFSSEKMLTGNFEIEILPFLAKQDKKTAVQRLKIPIAVECPKPSGAGIIEVDLKFTRNDKE